MGGLNSPLRTLTSLMEWGAIIPIVQQQESKCFSSDMMSIQEVPLKPRNTLANTHFYPHAFRTMKREIMSKHAWFITSPFWGSIFLQVNVYARTKWVIPWKRGLLQNTAVQLIKKFLTCQEPTSVPCPELDKSCLHAHNFLRTIFRLFWYLRLDLPSGLIPSAFRLNSACKPHHLLLLLELVSDGCGNKCCAHKYLFRDQFWKYYIRIPQVIYFTTCI